MRHWCKNNAIMSIIIRTCGLGVYSDECCSCMLPIWWGFGQLWPVHVKKGVVSLRWRRLMGRRNLGLISRIGGRGREEDIAVLLARFGEVLAAGCWGRVRLMVWGKKERARGGFVIHHEQHFFHAWCWLVILFTVIVANVAKTRFFCNNPCNKLLQKTVQDHHQRLIPFAKLWFCTWYFTPWSRVVIPTSIAQIVAKVQEHERLCFFCNNQCNRSWAKGHVWFTTLKIICLRWTRPTWHGRQSYQKIRYQQWYNYQLLLCIGYFSSN